MSPRRIAVVGATGLVGTALLECLAARAFPVAELWPLASSGSLGRLASFGGRERAVLELERFDFERCEIAFFCTPGAVARAHLPRAQAAHCQVIDLSEASRSDETVPLLIPALDDTTARASPLRIASPCAATLQLAHLLHPLSAACGIERVSVTVLAPASAAGREAVETLARESIAALSGRGADDENVTPVAFRCSPVDEHAAEEPLRGALIARELQRVLVQPQLSVRVSVVRVPVFYGQAMEVALRLGKPVGAAAARDVLRSAPGVAVLELPGAGGYPTAAHEAANRDTVCVGRIREDLAPDAGLNLWVAADNVRTGAANAVEIAEALVQRPI
ncbi:MAG: aspartate-semialdehyde dehydrogenase [Gammaproteobacteria bacterium]|nr:aspartate-semialdehyde dehydrogenase [Gammaproteobacteria bacterium]MBV9620465.1 aspartate-semialdehyde dehydrogenase [Gammaproteobacteria bacterium]